MSAVTLGLMIKLQNSLRSFQTRPATKRMLVRLVGFLPNGCKLLVFRVFWIWSCVQRIEDLCQVYTLIPSSRLMSFLGNSVRESYSSCTIWCFLFLTLLVWEVILWLDAQTQPWVSRKYCSLIALSTCPTGIETVCCLLNPCWKINLLSLLPHRKTENLCTSATPKSQSVFPFNQSFMSFPSPEALTSRESQHRAKPLDTFEWASRHWTGRKLAPLSCLQLYGRQTQLCSCECRKQFAWIPHLNSILKPKAGESAGRNI